MHHSSASNFGQTYRGHQLGLCHKWGCKQREAPGVGSGCFNRLPATHVRGTSVRGNLPGQCPLSSPVTSLLVSPYVFIFLNFFLNLLPGFHVFTGTVQRQAHPCYPSQHCAPSRCVRTFLGIIPLVSHGLSMECSSWSLWNVCAWPCFRCLTCLSMELKLVPPKKLGATCVGKELLKDLLYLLSGREPNILFYFLSYLYILIVPEVCSNPKVSKAVAISTGSLLVLLSVRIKK